MNDIQLETIEQIRAFLAGTEAIAFSMESTPERYAWIQHTLIRLRNRSGVRSFLFPSG